MKKDSVRLDNLGSVNLEFGRSVYTKGTKVDLGKVRLVLMDPTLDFELIRTH